MAIKKIFKTEDLPFVFINVAITADGKIAPANRKFVPFGSSRDFEHLLELRATADAVMSGARTIDGFPVKLDTGGDKFRRTRLKLGLKEQHLRIVVSGSGSLNPSSEIFKHKFSPIIILTTASAPKANLRRLEKLADVVKICGQKELDFEFALRWLRREWDVKRLLCEGGGEINAALFERRLVNELHVTLCPLILGGRNAPTMSDGLGFAKLADASRLKIKSQKRVGDELFMIYEVESCNAAKNLL